MWQLTPPYKAHWYICFTANKCSHKYDLIAGMDISEAQRADVRRSLFDPLHTITGCSQTSLVGKHLTLPLWLYSSFQHQYLQSSSVGGSRLQLNYLCHLVTVQLFAQPHHFWHSLSCFLLSVESRQLQYPHMTCASVLRNTKMVGFFFFWGSNWYWY